MHNLQTVQRLEDGEYAVVVGADESWRKYIFAKVKREGLDLIVNPDLRYRLEGVKDVKRYFATSETQIDGTNTDGIVNDQLTFMVVNRELVKDAERYDFIRQYLAADVGDERGFLKIKDLNGVAGLMFDAAIDRHVMRTKAASERQHNKPEGVDWF